MTEPYQKECPNCRSSNYDSIKYEYVENHVNQCKIVVKFGRDELNLEIISRMNW